MFEAVIGLEIHAQLNTKTKLFCRCATQFGNTPNTCVCPVCLGMPGALPVLNDYAVELAVRAGHAVNGTIASESVFARKNYFYPDLPKGYQISQFEQPICVGGSLSIRTDTGDKVIHITRIHMEEDAGKLVHQGADSIAGSEYSLVDLNRAGTPLIEIVSEPDIRTPAEARQYAEHMRLILTHMDVCDGDMEKGNLRVDANISIRPVGATAFGTRTEIKNLNSFRSLERAVQYEIQRQTDIVTNGEQVVQQTRHFDDVRGITTPLRDKEDAHDYRYFPDPDLKPLILSDTRISGIKQHMPEHPSDKRRRYHTDYAIPDSVIRILLSDVDLDHYFNRCIAVKGDVAPHEISKWLTGDFMSHINTTKQLIPKIRIQPDQFVALLQLRHDGSISGKMAKQILGQMFDTGGHPADLVATLGGTQISDQAVLDDIVKKILDQNVDVVAKVKAGKTRSADFLMGQVMKETKGRAQPDAVKQLILSQIDRYSL